MVRDARFLHTNLICRNWRDLADFYAVVFGCTPVPPERDLFGPQFEAGTGVPGAHARGMHMRLPGFGDGGPTLEIFEYDGARAPASEQQVTAPGFAHIAFAVASVDEAREDVLRHGGSPLGEIIRTFIEPDRYVTWCYVRDPEGNIIELQHAVTGASRVERG